MNYGIYVMCGVSLLQCLALAALLKRRRDLDGSRIDARLAHYGEALALLTDTTQSGFATVAAQLEGAGARRAPATSRGARSKRIALAARKGRSVQDIAADEELSESEIRLHLGLMREADAAGLAAPAGTTTARLAVAKPTVPIATPTATPAAVKPAAAVAKRVRAGVLAGASASASPAIPAVAHDGAARVKSPARRRGNVLDLGA